MTAPITVLVGDQDITGQAEELSWSAIDGGGFEAASFRPTQGAGDRVRPGQTVRILCGLETAWYGRVAEPQRKGQGAKSQTDVGCEGFAARLKGRKNLSMVYVDRDLKSWGAMSRTRDVFLRTRVAPSYTPGGTTETLPDVNTGAPSLTQKIDKLNSTSGSVVNPVVESWYDAGQGNLISRIYYDLAMQGPLGGWTIDAFLSVGDDASSFQSGTVYPGPTGAAEYLVATTPLRWAGLQTYFAGTSVLEDGWAVYWRSLAVYGDHGLPLRGAAPAGFYASDIARHALGYAEGTVVPGVIEDAVNYTVPHAVYRDLVSPDVVVSDMALQAGGWHWGVWEPLSPFDDTPRFDFRPPPPEATCYVSLNDCSDWDISEHMQGLFNEAVVKYGDVAGSGGYVTVIRSVPALDEIGETRTLEIDLGTGSSESARALGIYALALSEKQNRAAGSVTLPDFVRLPGGGTKPACLLRPGIDRIALTDLPWRYGLFDDPRAVNTFRISRASSVPEPNGRVKVTAELDAGSNLLDTLTARLAGAGTVAGS